MNPESIRHMVLDAIASRSIDNSILSSVIERDLNISGVLVRDAVRDLRRSGVPIVATPNGYFLASTAEEVDLIVQDLEKRIRSLSTTLSKIKLTAHEQFGGQRRFSFSSRVPGNAAGKATHIYGDSEAKSRGVFFLQNNREKNVEGSNQSERENFSLDALLQP